MPLIEEVKKKEKTFKAEGFWGIIGGNFSRVEKTAESISYGLYRQGKGVDRDEIVSELLVEMEKIYAKFDPTKCPATPIFYLLKYARLTVWTRYSTRRLTPDISEILPLIPDNRKEKVPTDTIDRIKEPFDRWVLSELLAGKTWEQITRAVCKRKGTTYYASQITKLKNRIKQRNPSLERILRGFNS